MEARTYNDESVSKVPVNSPELLLCRDLQAHDLIPGLKTVRTFPAILFRFQAVATWTKMFADRSKGGEEALSMVRRRDDVVAEWAV
jgi:hypothetical protein